MGNDIYQKLKLPSKNILKVVQSQQFIEKRMKGLQDYLRSVLLLIPGSVEVKFIIKIIYCIIYCIINKIIKIRLKHFLKHHIIY